MNSTDNTLAALAVGDRIRLTQDYGFFDAGDTGRILLIEPGEGLSWIAFDGGATQIIPVAVLARAPQEFRYRVRGGAMSGAFTSEQAASDAAEEAGLLEWDVIEIQHVARYEIVSTDECPPPGSVMH